MALDALVIAVSSAPYSSHRCLLFLSLHRRTRLALAEGQLHLDCCDSGSLTPISLQKANPVALSA
jgi:hypothetical protein